MTETIQAPVRALARPLERLEAEIVELATQITGATARLIAMIGEFDAAEGWRDWGMRSTAHWLSWKCGIGLNAGREQVRVARALAGLPLIASAFAAGRLSYSKVRAVTRFATEDNEQELLELAESATAAQMERLLAAVRKVRSADEVRERHAARGVRYHFDDDGSLVGVAQFDRSNDEPEAEFAIEVDRGWKSHRLGSLLLTDLLADARQCGIRHLTATYFLDNVPIVRLLRDVGTVMHVSTSYDAGIGSADIDLG